MMGSRTERSIGLIALALLVGLTALAPVAEAQMPKGATAVTGLEIDRFVGKWYEIARIDFKFERDLDHTTTVYSLKDNGTLKVVNRGYNFKKGKWTEATGKGKFVKDPTVGELKVSFFGPFYSPYNIIELDPDYRHALIVGKNTDYLWILSRTPELPEEAKAKYLRTAEQLGYDLDRIVWPDQSERE